MHPNENLVEQYVRIIKNWFTITNIKLSRNREIDILAVDVKGQAYQIEVDIHKTGLQWGPEGNDGYSVLEYKERKFNNEIKQFIKNKFAIENTKNIWVCWGMHPNSKKKALKEAKKHEIEIWEFKDRVKELYDVIGTAHYGNDIIQALSIVKAATKIKI